MTTEEMTFNDLPKVVAQLLDKISGLVLSFNRLYEDIKKSPSRASEHIPMNIDEACEFLKMKKGTMYYHLHNRSIPATKKGKSYIFFKDELIKWAESGRTTDVPLTPEETNLALSKRVGKNTQTDISKLLRKK